MTSNITWRRTTPPQALDYRCDAPGCDKKANTVHFIPYVTDDMFRELAFACPDHDPGGYWTDIKGLWTGPHDMRCKCGKPATCPRKYTAIEHIRDKQNVTKALGAMWDRIDDLTKVQS